MPRYFTSLTPTGRALVVGGRPFVFEPVEPMGGSWLGVLAVDDESAASHLVANDIDEITAERFDALKKKRTGAGTAQGFVPSRTPQLPPQPLEVAASPAVRHTSSDFESLAPAAAVSSSVTSTPLGSVALLTTNKPPPAEPLLEAGAPKRRKAA